jgi:hypothetical protein
MTYASAVAMLAKTAIEAEQVVGALCTLATIAHLSGRYRNRDENVATAADLLAHTRRFALRSGKAPARLLS